MDAILNVRTKKEFVFNPNKLLIRVIGTDIVTKKAQCYYELIEEGLSTEGRTSREWVDRGNVELPLDAVSNAFVNGVPNPQIVNAILANFNLELA